ncbi:MAG: MmgE/PrpD family protein [Alphaproteobacteria bacterium]|jgi:2-methylcitrate dehydratase PrpD|nr:MmgE/PrpD family protein [Alphaproteobacteria bacterium]MDP6565950.1 MmgE/PrpD family protein [Alphaproteobacteria bacterium]MDP6814303.1 MmgE/PrpD family protein [Alphaproteobacteria bacterium]
MDEALDEVIGWLLAEDPLRADGVEGRARLLFLDSVGCLIAGLAKPEVRALGETLARLDGGKVRLPSLPTPLSTTAAAYLAGLATCWDEACEGLPRAHGRPGLHSFAAALPLALAERRQLGAALSALVSGFEVAGRLGEVLRIPPGMHVDGTWGTFGAVAAAARLLGLTPDTTGAAIRGAACHLPWSLYLPISHGATVRNAYVGEAAARGIRQAGAAAAGITAPAGAIESFDRLALGGDPAAKRLAPPGQWLIAEGYLKPFAGVRHVHYGVQAALDWRRSNGAAEPGGIRALELAVYPEALTYCGNRAPTTPIQAQFSLSYGLAWALLQGDLGPDAYDAAALADRRVRELEAMVSLVEDAELGRQGGRAARLTVTTAAGSRALLVDSLPGDPDRPLTAAEAAAKFRRFTTPLIGSQRSDDIATAILTGPLSADLGDLLAL